MINEHIVNEKEEHDIIISLDHFFSLLGPSCRVKGSGAREEG